MINYVFNTLAGVLVYRYHMYSECFFCRLECVFGVCCVGVVDKLGDACSTGVGNGADGVGEREIASGWF